MEQYSRHKRRLSEERGILLYKGVQVLDIGGWATEHLHLGIMRTIRQIIKRGADTWPESVWRIYLINVPWMFMNAWTIIKAWCHPVTLAKVHIYRDPSEFR